MFGMLDCVYMKIQSVCVLNQFVTFSVAFLILNARLDVEKIIAVRNAQTMDALTKIEVVYAWKKMNRLPALLSFVFL